MRCFVITKKHIIALLCLAALIVSAVIIAIKKEDSRAVTTFNSSSPDEIVSHVLPTTDSQDFFSNIKTYVKNQTKKKPENVLHQFSSMFSEKEASPPAAATQTPAPTQIPTIQKTTTSQAAVKNDTEYEISSQDFLNEPLGFSEGAQVLIIHTHTTESYTPEEPTGLPDNSRSTDETKNMIAIGEVIKTKLEESGITVIHDKTVHDYPSYQGAYGRSLATANNQIQLNNNIQIVLDIHRDAVVNNEGTRVKLVKDVNGALCAQMMIVCGTDGNGLSHPGWRKNLSFAFKIQEKVNSKYPDLMRPINIRKERFNQHLTPGSLILEIGTHGNSLTEAKNGASLLAGEIAEIIKPSV